MNRAVTNLRESERGGPPKASSYETT
jgi:hypothetical protein